jgi:hypothetical protein
MTEDDLDRGVAVLEKVARRLSQEQLDALAAAVRNAPPSAVWDANERYWFSGTAGLRLNRAEEAALRRLWTRIQASLVFAVTGEEIESRVEGATAMARLDRLLSSRRDLSEGWSAMVLERAMGTDVWFAVIGIWNAMCAALLAKRMSEDIRKALQEPWRQVLHHPLKVR